MIYSQEAGNEINIDTHQVMIKKMWYISTVESYSTAKKNETIGFAGRCMEMENIIQSEVMQAPKDKFCMFPLIYGTWIQFFCFVCLILGACISQKSRNRL